MTVTTAQGGVPLPAGTTILRIDGNIIYLSQIPAISTPLTQTYNFSKPQPIPYDPRYTTPYSLTFDTAATPGAQLFAGSVYAAMSAIFKLDSEGSVGRLRTVGSATRMNGSR
jgi:hypothetical protein